MTDPYLPEKESSPDLPSPWGFRIFVFLAAVYLLYRLGQGIAWLVTRFSS